MTFACLCLSTGIKQKKLNKNILHSGTVSGQSAEINGVLFTHFFYAVCEHACIVFVVFFFWDLKRI